MSPEAAEQISEDCIEEAIWDYILERRIKMGDAADDLLDGSCCESCGDWMGEAIGYPRNCEGCKADAKKEQKKQAAKK